MTQIKQRAKIHLRRVEFIQGEECGEIKVKVLDGKNKKRRVE